MNDLPYNAEESYPLRTEQIIASSGDIGGVTGDMQAEIAPGESVSFQFAVFVSNLSDGDFAFEVKAPPNPNGGFQILGADIGAGFQMQSYGGDDFNTPTTTLWRGGAPDVLLGYDTHIITGNLANGAQPGLLRLAISEVLAVSETSSVHVMPGSNLVVKRIGNSRQNEVGA